jgi:hypothetical protein
MDQFLFQFHSKITFEQSIAKLIVRMYHVPFYEIQFFIQVNVLLHSMNSSYLELIHKNELAYLLNARFIHHDNANIHEFNELYLILHTIHGQYYYDIHQDLVRLLVLYLLELIYLMYINMKQGEFNPNSFLINLL